MDLDKLEMQVRQMGAQVASLEARVSALEKPITKPDAVAAPQTTAEPEPDPEKPQPEEVEDEDEADEKAPHKPAGGRRTHR